MNTSPLKPTGSDNEANFVQKIFDMVYRRLRFIDTPTCSWNKGPNGISANVKASQSSGTPATVKAYKLVSMAFDYVVASPVTGGANVQIMKEYKLRESLMAETIFGVVHNYTYQPGPDALNIQRTDGGELQRVVPPWTVGEIFYAVKTTDTSVVASGLLMQGRSAQWSQINTTGQ